LLEEAEPLPGRCSAEEHGFGDDIPDPRLCFGTESLVGRGQAVDGKEFDGDQCHSVAFVEEEAVFRIDRTQVKVEIGVVVLSFLLQVGPSRDRVNHPRQLATQQERHFFILKALHIVVVIQQAQYRVKGVVRPYFRRRDLAVALHNPLVAGVQLFFLSQVSHKLIIRAGLVADSLMPDVKLEEYQFRIRHKVENGDIFCREKYLFVFGFGAELDAFGKLIDIAMIMPWVIYKVKGRIPEGNAVGFVIQDFVH